MIVLGSPWSLVGHTYFSDGWHFRVGAVSQLRFARGSVPLSRQQMPGSGGILASLFLGDSTVCWAA